MIVAFVHATAVRSGLGQLEVVRPIPVNPLGRCTHDVEKRCDLFAIVMPPRRVAGLRDPDLRVRAVLEQDVAHAGNLRVPSIPPEIKRARETVNSNSIDVAQYPTLTH